MQTRREFLKTTARVGMAIALPSCAVPPRAAEPAGVEVNDVQSQLNPTRVNRIVQPTSINAIQAALRDARAEGRSVSVAGGRHAMGGQQFGRDTVLLDMRQCVLSASLRELFSAPGYSARRVGSQEDAWCSGRTAGARNLIGSRRS